MVGQERPREDARAGCRNERPPLREVRAKEPGTDPLLTLST